MPKKILIVVEGKTDLKNYAIGDGRQQYSITLDDQYLLELYFDHDGVLVKRVSAEKRLKGMVTKTVTLEPGEFFKVEPTKIHEPQPSFADNVSREAERLYSTVFASEETRHEVRPVILWNHYARRPHTMTKHLLRPSFAV